MCGYKTDVGGGGARVGWGCFPRKYIGCREERVGQVKNRYVTISEGS